MEIRKCTRSDLPLLARLNKCLIEDEGSGNSMSEKELLQRMRIFIAGDYDAYLFVQGGGKSGGTEDVLGYALVRRTSEPLYLRQFYIRREHRRRHCGEQAFSALMSLLNAGTLDLEVLSGNTGGLAFWGKMGFREYSRCMRLERADGAKLAGNAQTGETSGISVRKAESSDAAAICRICREDLGYSCTEELVLRGITSLDHGRERVLVATNGGKAVGFVHAEVYRLLYFEPMLNILGLAPWRQISAGRARPPSSWRGLRRGQGRSG